MYVDLFDSKNLSIVVTYGPSSYYLMLFKFTALFSQNLNSTKGPGFYPFFNAYSGSSFNTFLIYLVQVIIDDSNTWALSLAGVLSETVNLCDGNGYLYKKKKITSFVLPSIYPIMT